jgi:hypothetical protein
MLTYVNLSTNRYATQSRSMDFFWRVTLQRHMHRIPIGCSNQLFELVPIIRYVRSSGGYYWYARCYHGDQYPAPSSYDIMLASSNGL